MSHPSFVLSLMSFFLFFTLQLYQSERNMLKTKGGEVVWIRNFPYSPVFEHLAPQLVALLGLTKRYSSVEKYVTRRGLWAIRTSPYFLFTVSSSCLWLKMCWLSLHPVPVPCLPPAAMLPCHNGFLSPWKTKSKDKAVPSTDCLGYCVLVAATESN